MEDMLETELWYINLEVYYRESCHMCIDLNDEEGNDYEDCQPEKQINMVQHLTHTSDLEHMEFMRLK